MGAPALPPGAQFQPFAPVLRGFLRDPGQQPPTKTARTIVFERDEVVDVDKSSGEERCEAPVPGHASDLPALFDEGKEVTLFLLALHLGDELLRPGKLRAK